MCKPSHLHHEAQTGITPGSPCPSARTADFLHRALWPGSYDGLRSCFLQQNHFILAGSLCVKLVATKRSLDLRQCITEDLSRASTAHVSDEK
uniref:Uncharacterized protein n=1 Tax=Anguilla anguilla TaxID=7936 RepID=A0A0E9VAM3_ANGAN